MASNKTKNVEPNINPVDLGLEAENSKIEEIKEEVSIVTGEPVANSYEDKKLAAAATVALKSAINANAEVALRESERAYAAEKRNHMLKRCKTDKVVTITPAKIFANIFGSTYTFGYNGIPVTVRFDGTPQEFPKFIADKIQEKIQRTSEANTYKEEIEHLS